MLSWLAKKVISYNMARARAGDIGPTLRLDASDVTFRFPGDNSWAGEFHGKEQVRAWLQRFVAVGLQIFPDEVVATGWPWGTTVCIRGRDHLLSPDGQIVYENRYVIWAHLAWGLVKDYEVYEDTQRSRGLDDWLGEHRPALASASASA
jgi:ketosteroid isomerase-like protein